MLRIIRKFGGYYRGAGVKEWVVTEKDTWMTGTN